MCGRGPGHKLPSCPQLLLQLVTCVPAGLELPFQGCQVLPPLQGLLNLSLALQVSHLGIVLLKHKRQLMLVLCLQCTV